MLKILQKTIKPYFFNVPFLKKILANPMKIPIANSLIITTPANNRNDFLRLPFLPNESALQTTSTFKYTHTNHPSLSHLSYKQREQYLISNIIVDIIFNQASNDRAQRYGHNMKKGNICRKIPYNTFNEQGETIPFQHPARQNSDSEKDNDMYLFKLTINPKNIQEDITNEEFNRREPFFAQVMSFINSKKIQNPNLFVRFNFNGHGQAGAISGERLNGEKEVRIENILYEQDIARFALHTNYHFTNGTSVIDEIYVNSCYSAIESDPKTPNRNKSMCSIIKTHFNAKKTVGYPCEVFQPGLDCLGTPAAKYATDSDSYFSPYDHKLMKRLDNREVYFLGDPPQ